MKTAIERLPFVAIAALGLVIAAPGARADQMRLEGRAIEGGLIVGKTEPGNRVTVAERPVRVGEDGTFLIALPMDAPETMELAIEQPDGSRELHTFRVEQRAYETERIDGLPDDEVNLDRRTRAAMRRAHQQIEKLRRRWSPQAHFSGGFDWPAHGRVSSRYGVRRVLNGEPRAPHDAVDIAVPIGTTVRAPAAGVVVFAQDDVPLAGPTVIVDHGLGLTSTFLHLSAIRVRPGQPVTGGMPVGLSGNAGRTTGPHLEWSVHLLGVALDPELLVNQPAPEPRVSAAPRQPTPARPLTPPGARRAGP